MSLNPTRLWPLATAVGGAALASLSLVGLPDPAVAGRIHPALQEELSHLALNEPATAIFILKDQVDLPALSAALSAQHATRQERHRVVIETLQAKARETQGPLVAHLGDLKARGQVAGFTPYWISNLVVIRATRSTIEDLAARADVEVAEVNHKPVLIAPVAGPDGLGDQGGTRGIGVTPGLRAVKAPDVWYGLGIRGEGTLLGSMDTGVDGNHPALKTRWRGFNNAHPWQECWHDVLGSNTQFPSDSHSHGTHTTGTMTGLGATTQDSIGVSPASLWIAANAINQSVTSEFDNDVTNCFQWFADPDGNPNTVDDVPDAICNSWGINEGFGGSPPYTDCDTRWWGVLDGCEAAGTVIVFAAGNEGSGAQTLRSPADRATTIYNVFSVGAVDATSFNWPYPIAGFSSRGPSGCAVPQAQKIKPEVSAPGVDVYSSVPGGGYQQSGWSGTSMATPHVTGTVALMRSANPDIEVDTIKQILMANARDEGTAGEDNTYGWGFIDAYNSVVEAAVGLGTITGTVTNASNGGTPLQGATVRLVETNRTFQSDAAGAYGGPTAVGVYTVECTHPSFATQSVGGVNVVANQVTTQNFAMVDILGPSITNTVYSPLVPDDSTPIPVRSTFTDFSAITLRELVYRVNGGGWSTAPMTLLSGNEYQGIIPANPIGTHIDFYIHGRDVASNHGYDPATAPAITYSFDVSQAFFADDAETDKGWSLTTSGDSPSGRWTRNDPYGTTYNNQQVEPADDHTPAPGVNCLYTGRGQSGGQPGTSDVDNGCVTLTSPVLDLQNASSASVSYWRWFGAVAQSGVASGNLEASVSSNNGANWVQLENITTNQNSWTSVLKDLATYITFTSQVRFRFKACDTGAEDLIEAAIDDFVVQGALNTVDAEDGAVAAGNWLFVNRPNPASPETAIRFRLAQAGPASLTIFDAGGRRVRSLARGAQTAGDHLVAWDGRDDQGHPVASGVYLYRMETEGFQAERKMLLIH